MQAGAPNTSHFSDLQFVADGVFYAELNELLTRELAEHGYSGVEVRVTPIRTEIIIRATRTQNVLGEPLASLAQHVPIRLHAAHHAGPICPGRVSTSQAPAARVAAACALAWGRLFLASCSAAICASLVLQPASWVVGGWLCFACCPLNWGCSLIPAHGCEADTSLRSSTWQ